MTVTSLFTAFLCTLVSIVVLRPLARKLGLMDTPGGRKSHTRDTPLIGGFGIYIGLLIACLLNPEVFGQYELLLGISAILLLTGVIDDYYPLPATARLGIQVLAAWLMAAYGENQLITLGKLVGDWQLFLGRFTMVMTIFATVGVINAINMIDGMDGLSGGMVVICLVYLAYATSLSGSNPALYGFLLILIACLLAFLVLNFRFYVKKPALIYLGDSGSTMLGFILAWILIESSQGGSERIIPATVALWFLAIPLMDTVYLLIARPLTGKSPFEPGTDHLHHLLLKHGLGRPNIVMLLYCAATIFGATGVFVLLNPQFEPYSLYGFLGVFLLFSVLMKREKQY